MPLPINKQKSESKFQLDLSFLATKDDKILTASDNHANLLMKIWSVSNKIDNSKFSIKNDISLHDFDHLKKNGLVTGNIDSCEFTNKAKKVITVLTLGESNAFLKNKVQKSYSEILASTKKTLKNGYRIPKTANSNVINSCKLKFGNSSAILSFETWLKMGRIMGWDK